MSLSTNTVNVLRYGALGAGIVYGLVHQRSLTKQAKAHAVEAEYKRKEALIAEAKAEWAKRQAPVQSVTASGGVISDPEDPRFDLEAFLTQLSAQEKKQ